MLLWPYSVSGWDLGGKAEDCVHLCLPTAPAVNYPVALGKLVTVVTAQISEQSSHLFFQFGTDTGYFPASSHADTCHYVVDANYSNSNVTVDHTHF